MIKKLTDLSILSLYLLGFLFIVGSVVLGIASEIGRALTWIKWGFG